MAEEIVLPESLVADLINKVGKIGAAIDETFKELAKQRGEIREKMKRDGAIAPSVIDANVASNAIGIAVDGASLVEIDRASSYGIACVARVGPDQSYSEHRSNMFVLPHAVGIDGLANGFMMMQELMLATETAQEHPHDFVFIDGSKISFIIKLNQFYSIFKDEGLKAHLDTWRKPNNKSDAATVLREFESKDWFSAFFSLPNIVGNLKLVTTDSLVREYLSEAYHGRFDDKTVAALVLEPGERTRATSLKNPMGDSNPPYHMSENFPFHREFAAASKVLVTPNAPERIGHVYFRVPTNDSIYKIEVTAELIKSKASYDALYDWLTYQSCAIDLQEPYPMYVVDRFVKEAASISKEAIHEIMRAQSSSDWGFYFSGPYRTA